MYRNPRTITIVVTIALSTALLSQPLLHGNSNPPQQRVSIPEISTPKLEKMIDVGGRKLHCCRYGEKGPTVVLVSGFGAQQSYWNTVVPDLAAKTTVVTFDRAGIGDSEIGNLPTHGLQSAKDLYSILKQLGTPKPYILVGHSYGGDVVRIFASLYPDCMGGLILEDTQHESILEEQRTVLTGSDLEMLEQMVARFGTPENPVSEADYRNITRKQAGSTKPLPRIPFVVLTAGDRLRAMPPMFSDEGKEKLATLGLELQQRLVALIPGGEHIVIEGVGHNIHIEKPDALIEPISEMIDRIRK